eukprot:2263097-Amphidinium_carterae.1
MLEYLIRGVFISVSVDWKWFKNEPSLPDVADPVLERFLDMSLDSNGLVWTDTAAQLCARTLPNRQAADEAERS